jgi:hypothetical protein
LIRPWTMPRDQQTIRTGVPLGRVHARAMLIEAEVDGDGAGCSLQEIGVEVGSHIGIWGWGGRGEEGEEGEEGGDGEGLHCVGFGVDGG